MTMRYAPATGFLLLLIGLLAGVPAAQADGWTQKRGHGYYKLGFRLVSATRFYNPGGNRISIPTLRTYTASFYGEYGLTNRLTAVAYVPFFERITLNRQVGENSGFEFFPGDAASGPGDADVGLRFGLRQNQATVLSVGLRLGLPTGQDDQQNGLVTGDGELNQLVTLEAGHSFYPIPAYVKATVGFNNRVNGYSDEIIALLEGGYTFDQKLTLTARLRRLQSLKNGEDAVLGGTGGLYANNQQYLLYGVEVAYSPDPSYGIALGVEGATLAQNVLAAPAFSIGVFLKR